MVEIESAYVYLFDCFPKSKDQGENQSKNDGMILKLRNLTRVDPLIDSTLEIDHTVDEMTATDKETKYVWDFNDLEPLLQSVKQISSASKLDSDLGLTKKMVKAVKIFWIDIDKLPFFSLTFCLTIDVKEVEPEAVMMTILNAVRPIQALFDSLKGVSTELIRYRPCAPFLIYLGARCSSGELQMLFKNVYAVKNAQIPFNDIPQLGQVQSLVEEIRKFAPVGYLPSDSRQITALLLRPNLLPFLGYWKQRESGLKHHFIITISQDEKLLYQQPKTSFSSTPIFSISGFGSSLIYDPNYGPGYLIRLISITIWSRYLILKFTNNTRLRELHENLQNLLLVGDRDVLREHLMRLNKEGTSEVHLRANVAEFRMALDPYIMPILDQDEQSSYEVPVIDHLHKSTLNDHRYIRAMNASIVAKYNELLQMLDQRIMEYEKIQMQVANIVSLDIEKVNLDIQHTITRYTKISVGAGIASAIAAIVAIAVAMDLF
ncbi:MAG TPA: hypothetical protein VE566_02085 [Nitrososphaeraceae archaeon]|nr:hypothetical protein [Nitrososphaeraceae archaeon]